MAKPKGVNLGIAMQRVASPESVSEVRQVLEDVILTGRPEHCEPSSSSDQGSARPQARPPRPPVKAACTRRAEPIEHRSRERQENAPPRQTRASRGFGADPGSSRGTRGATGARSASPMRSHSAPPPGMEGDLTPTGVTAHVSADESSSGVTLTPAVDEPSSAQQAGSSSGVAASIEAPYARASSPTSPGSPSRQRRCGEAVGQPHAEVVLQCHVLFSSPLCVERPVVVRLPCDQSPTDVEEKIASWRLEFETSHPSVVRTVHPGGIVSSWNAEQEHIEGLVRPGDELLWLSMNGVREALRGRSLTCCFRDLVQRVEPWRQNASLANVDAPNHVELVFRALRALSPLRVDDEIELVRQSGCQVTANAATAHNVRALIAAAKCQILHLSLHCSVAQDQLLFFEDGHGKAHVIRAGELKTMLLSGQAQQNIRLVFVNACHSLSLGVHFVEAGVKHVVCVKNEEQVRDESCRLFARDFFAALRAGRTVQEAFDCGRAVLACSQEQHLRKDASSFVLLPEEGDHNDVFVAGGAQFAPRAPTPPGGSWGALFAPVEDFMGREGDMHRLLHLIAARRFVEVHGEQGIGKSALLTEIGRFIALRRDAFIEVRLVETGTRDERVRQGCLAGLECLRQRLADDSLLQRVLLLVDDPDMLMWKQLEPLLRFNRVHMVLATAPKQVVQLAESDACAGTQPLSGLNPAAHAAVASGLKPASFEIRPLEPLAQVRLFLRRAPRPLDMSELHCQAPGPAKCVLPPPQKPVDFLRLAETPLFEVFGGNPAKIVRAAAKLGLSPPALCGDVGKDLEPRAISADASAGPCRTSRSIPAEPAASDQMHLANRRRVRLLRPDGRSRDEWLLRSTPISQVLEAYSPKRLANAAILYVAGCYAPTDALLGDFPDDPELGLLVLEFRSGTQSDNEEW